MTTPLLTVDQTAYRPKEAAVLVVGLAWVLMIGSSTLAAIILCGWKGAKSIAMDWIRMRATFTCK